MGKEIKNYIFKEGIILVIIILLLLTSIVPSSIGQTNALIAQQNKIAASVPATEKTSTFTFYVIGKNGLEKQETMLPISDVLKIYEKYQELKKETTLNPYDQKTQRVQQEFFDLLIENHALPTTMSKDQLNSLTQPSSMPSLRLRTNIQPFQSKASEWFCNFATFGSGSAFPIIILPRFIPFLLTPIPRAFIWWSTPEGITSVGGLISGTGFLAGGQQKGIALGFWGIGFSIFLPPIRSYGIFGYALYTRVTAEEFEFYPPNYSPEITQTDPADGQQMVPISTTELRFEINDANGDLMSYNVTTEPDIGSGSGGLKPDGTYSVPISGLESLVQYTWYIQVTDGKDIVEKTLTFTTEPVAPILTNPIPANGEKDVPMDITSLQFTLKDYQGDAMEYSVETTPNIGSKHEVGVHDGTYTVPVSSLTYGDSYCWFVNVTDGTYWTRKVFNFETGYPSQFDPFNFGWQYRKQIIIDHTQLISNQNNFPILISTIDADLMKARADGGDILFMNNIGVASKLYHDIDLFNQSTGKVVTWVKIPLLSSTIDTVIFMYYGNPSSLYMAYPEKVWDGFEAVYHLSKAPTGVVQDNTGNSNNGVPHGSMTISNLVDGKIGSCYLFDGDDDYISFTDFTYALNEGTCSAWIQTSGNGPMAVWGEGVISSPKPYIWLGKRENGKLMFARDVSGGNSNFQGQKEVGMNDGIWHFISWISTGSENRFFFDGAEVSLVWQDGQNPNGIWFNDQNTDASTIGCLTQGGPYNLWAGLLDEIKITSTPLSATWIAAEYANQNNPSGFLSFGPEVPGP
ncbi:MAG: hypothetical protein IMZ43_09105 [Thermoplasmata archaeon]|nr:hypothetical protein [Thermoplasmata archaeon]